MPGIASAATAVLIGQVACGTATIRVGADSPAEARSAAGASSLAEEPTPTVQA